MDASTTEKTQRYFSPRRLGHANLWVSDYERAYDYYRNVIGFEHAYIQPDNQASFVSNGNTYHDYGLIDIHGRYAKPGQNPGLNHFAFELRNELELAEGYRRAKAAGVQFSSLQDHDVAHAAYQLDPDGNQVEVYADVVADWRAARSGVIIKFEWHGSEADRCWRMKTLQLRLSKRIIRSTNLGHAYSFLRRADQPAVYGFDPPAAGHRNKLPECDD